MPRKKQILNKGFGSEIKRYRISKNLTQQMLADKTGLSNVQINKYENAQSIPKLPVLKKLSKILDIPESDLIKLATESKASQNNFPGYTDHQVEWLKNVHSLDDDLFTLLDEFAGFVFLKQTMRRPKRKTSTLESIVESPQ